MKKYLILGIFFLNILIGYSQEVKRNMSIKDFLSIPSISDIQVSPDGNSLLYILTESNWNANRQISHIWQVNKNGENTKQLTFGLENESEPLWSPNGKWISFLAKRKEDKQSQIYIMPSDGGESKRLTNHKTSVSNVSWSPDSKKLYFTANDPFTAEEENLKSNKIDVYPFEENYKQKHLWEIDRATNEKKITSGDYSVLTYSLSHDGNRIAVHKSPSPLLDDSFKSEIWLINNDGSGEIQLTDNSVSEITNNRLFKTGARIAPNNKSVMFTAAVNGKMEDYYNNKLFLLASDGSSDIDLLTKDFPYEVSAAEWTSDGGKIFFVANMGSQFQLWQYEIASKKLVQLTEGKHSIGQWTYNPKQDEHFVTIKTMENPGEIFSFKKGKLKQITHHNDSLKIKFNLPRQEVISWKGEDGVTVEGMIYYPHNYNPEKTYPLVVQTHGGPRASEKYGMSLRYTTYVPVLTGMEYVVLQPNYRGSTGYGDDFLRGMVGGYYDQSHLDVMAGVDFLIEKGIADPERMIKMGWSAGGHMTNKLITFTNRFKAASSGAGAVNWISMYSQSNVRYNRDAWFGGTPWQKDAPIEVYWNHSPLKDISNVETPTLVIVGENDPVVPKEQSVELYRALKSNNVPTHLYIAPREVHRWMELQHRLYKINVELEWFAKYALNKPYEWEYVK
ncbi:S9 family peptidase [Arenibacter algicola]|uniref:S9 family peptidase n=1 Tax=Arenibacter algicola TaxID=616991 RepID=UPI001C07CFCB|nr:S9 family peptidase [Arenibacter algicola]MBU2906528.1 S9 family peptidase [Arenibacter algicola]